MKTSEKMLDAKNYFILHNRNVYLHALYRDGDRYSRALDSMYYTEKSEIFAIA